MKRLLVLGAAVLAVSLYGMFGVDADTSDACGKWDPAGGPVHFNHKCHAERTNGKKVDTQDPAKCKDCHAVTDKGKILAPAQQGHAPCLQSGCHAKEFLGAPLNDAQAKKTPARTKSFCAGCHPQTPWAWKKPTVSIDATWHNQRDHHIEMGKSDGDSGMDHYKHTQLKKQDGKQIGCRDCHVVDDSGDKPTWAFATGTPGHAQCLSCHSAEGQAFPLSDCGNCHKEGSRRSWLLSLGVRMGPNDVETRPGSRVRSCGSEGYTRYVQKDLKPGKGVPCFKHETQQHRERKDGSGVQCVQCHYLVTDKSRWNGRSYASLADLHTKSIIHANPTDPMEKHHQACSARGCHAGQTENGPAKACEKCHPEL